MFKLSERTHSGLILMTCLAERMGEFLSLKEVASRMKLSEGYLEEVASALRAAGLVTGRTGPKGGYALTRPPEKITTEEVVIALEGPIVLVGCQEKGTDCPIEGGCSSKRVWNALQHRIQTSLRETTLAEIAG
ncbi:MAG TPA: Rrf2 family transcriptional regulator [Candidatus Methylomirabilis sp.]|nr:Rrf2 family transcriptional regulator [Candidatus Methylomirabilis sp.]